MSPTMACSRIQPLGPATSHAVRSEAESAAGRHHWPVAPHWQQRAVVLGILPGTGLQPPPAGRARPIRDPLGPGHVERRDPAQPALHPVRPSRRSPGRAELEWGPGGRQCAVAGRRDRLVLGGIVASTRNAARRLVDRAGNVAGFWIGRRGRLSWCAAFLAVGNRLRVRHGQMAVDDPWCFGFVVFVEAAAPLFRGR